MPLTVGSAANKCLSQRPADKRQHFPSSRYHPYQRLPLYKGSPSSGCETPSKETTLSTNAKYQDFQAQLNDLGIARPNEDPFEYAARLATRGATTEEGEGGSIFQGAFLKLTPYIVICPLLSLPINTTTRFRYQEPGCPTKFDTLALLKPSPLPFANCGPPIPSFVFAASLVPEINTGPYSLVQPRRSSPPPPPIEISASVQARIERTDREKLAEKIHEHLETNAEPVIGSIDNPFPLADQYGIKGISVLSAFFHHLDMNDFTCHFCGDKCANIDSALEHQRVARHYNNQ